ncbi:MAG: glycosyltransferase family 4 protein [Sulfuricella sp.]|nr:glycosyltransferase family 4 protein [Gammaproteobacteria bacterium]
MKIGIAGPISKESIAQFFDGDVRDLPCGYSGAPLLSTLIGALLERGHSITAYTISSDLPLSERVTATGDRFKITFCPVRKRAFRYGDGHWGRAADAFKQERVALRQAMQDDAPDLVHAHWSYEFALAAIESGLPHLITCHDAPQMVLRYMPNPYRLVRYFMARQVLNRARYLTAVSPYLKQKLESYVRVPIMVVPNPLPAHPAHLTASVRQYDPAHPRIAMVLNGWGAHKNPQPALRAFAALRRRLPAAELSIMGSDYGVGGKAESWARSKGLTDGVHFLGPQSYPVLLAKLAESDLLLHPSLEETFGMSIAEAMSLGVPVVGGQASGAVPWVIGEGGVVTDVTSATTIEATIASLISDPNAYQEYGQAAKARVRENFSADCVAAAYESLYFDIPRG